MYPVLRDIARKHGYALGIHGSMLRDFDLISVPWVTEFTPAADLINAIRACYGYGRTGLTDEDTIEGPTEKPHGRRAYAVHLGGGARFDISVMVPTGHLFELRAAEDHLREQWRVTGSCPCGARAEALATHPHVSGCPTARAVDRVL